MRNLGAGAGFTLILVMANVVAAGVFQVLEPLTAVIKDEDLQLVALGVVGGLAIGAALCFLSGSMRAVVDQLQCRAGRRGG